MTRFQFRCLVGLCFVTGLLSTNRAFEAQPVPRSSASAPQSVPKAAPPTGNVAVWLKALEGNDAKAREQALEGFLNLGRPPAEAAPALKKLVDDPALTTRAKAAFLLWKLDPKPNPDWKLLREALKADDPALPRHAVGQLSRLTVQEPQKGLPLALEAATHPDRRVSTTGFNIAVQAVESNLDTLVAGLKHEEPAVHRAVLRVLAVAPDFREKSLPVVRTQLESVHLGVRAQAARTMWQLSLDAEAILPALRSVLQGKDADATREAFEVLFHLMPVHKAAADLYRLGLKSAELEIGIWSCRRLLEAQGWDAAIPGILRQGLKDDKLRRNAFYAVAYMGPKAKQLLPDLIAAVEKSPKFTDLGPVMAFGAVGADAVPEIIQMIELDPRKFDPIASRLIGAIGEPAVKPVSEALPKVLPELRLTLLSGLGATHSKAAAPVLVPYLKPETPLAERIAALGNLRALGYLAREAAPEVKKCLDDVSESIRREALGAYVHIFPSAVKVREALAEALKDKDLSVRFLAAQHMLWIDPQHESLARVFEELAKPETHSSSFWNHYSQLNAADCLILLPTALRATKGTQHTDAVLTLITTHSRALKGKLDPHRELLWEAVETLLKQDNLSIDAQLRRARVVGEIAWALGAHEDTAIQTISRTIENELKTPNTSASPLAVNRVINTLGRFGPKAKGTLPLIERKARPLSESSGSLGPYSPHIALCWIDPTRTGATLAKLPANRNNAFARLDIDPQDKEAIKTLGEWLESGDTSPQLYHRLREIENPPEALRASLEKALASFQAMPSNKPVNPFQLGGPSPTPDFYQVVLAKTLWQITGEWRKALPIFLAALKSGAYQGDVYDMVAKMGLSARDVGPELLRFEMNQPTWNFTQFQKAFVIDREAGMKLDLGK